MRARRPLAAHARTTTTTPLTPLTTPALTAMSMFAFVLVFIFVLIFFIFFVLIFFVVMPFGLAAVVGDQGDHTHPRPHGPLERRGAGFRGEDRPCADHQQ
jgi:hypothetical protein